MQSPLKLYRITQDMGIIQGVFQCGKISTGTAESMQRPRMPIFGVLGTLLQQQCGRKQKHSIPSMSSGVACDC